MFCYCKLHLPAGEPVSLSESVLWVENILHISIVIPRNKTTIKTLQWCQKAYKICLLLYFVY